MSEPAAIIQFQKKPEAKFICSACGEERACNCNAPAVEKLAEMKERERQRVRDAVRKHREKDKEKQAPVTVTGELECDAMRREEVHNTTTDKQHLPFQGDVVKLALSRVYDFARGYEKEMNAKQRREFRAKIIERFSNG